MGLPQIIIDPPFRLLCDLLQNSLPLGVVSGEVRLALDGLAVVIFVAFFVLFWEGRFGLPITGDPSSTAPPQKGQKLHWLLTMFFPQHLS